MQPEWLDLLFTTKVYVEYHKFFRVWVGIHWINKVGFYTIKQN